MSDKIRLSLSLLKKLYNILPPICSLPGIQEPEFYLDMNPAPNAYTFDNCLHSAVLQSAKRTKNWRVLYSLTRKSKERHDVLLRMRKQVMTKMYPNA